MAGKQLRFVVDGDLVYGMANSTTPFVGKVGDPMGARTKEIGGAMAAASSSSSGKSGKSGRAGKKCKLTINGRPVATVESVASSEAMAAIQARPLMFSKSVMLNGKPLLLHGGAFMASPDGTLQSLCVNQTIMYGPASSMPPIEGGELPPSEEGRSTGSGSGATARSNYDQPSAEHVMLSRCSSARLADLLPPEYAVLVGDPVDVATGAVVTNAVDDHRASPELAFARHYASNRSHRDGPLGHGWSHSFEQAIWLEPGRVVLFDAGREIEFDCFALLDQVTRGGDVLQDLTGRLTLRCHGHNNWELSDGDSVRHFVPVPGTPSRDRDRGYAQLSTIARPDQPLVELHYDGSARLESVRVDGNSIFSLRYDTEDRLHSINGGVARYDYAMNGDLIEVADLEGNARSYAYQGHLLVRETNRRGGEFHYGYDRGDTRARCVRTWGTGGRLDRVLSYESGTTLVTDSQGNRTIYTLSPMGLVVGIEDAEGRAAELTYDAQLRLTNVTYADATSAADLYDEHGHRAKHRERGGATWRMVSDTAGRLVEGFDPQNGQWQFAYDLAGRLTRVEDPLGHVTSLEYADARLSAIVDPLGRLTEVRLGPHDEVLALQPPAGCAVTYAYDEQGRLTNATPDAGEEVRWHYDVYGRLVAVASGVTNVQLTRDEEGSVTSVATPNCVEHRRRDPFGLLLGSRNGEVEIGYQYDSEGRLIAASRDGHARIALQHDTLGRVSAYTIDNELEGEVRYARSSGRVEGIDEGDRRISLTWDPAGRLANYDVGCGLCTFSYREDGLMMGYATPDHTCTIERDALGVVLAQAAGQTKIESRHVDHRGDRYGVDTGDGHSISYLWASDGQLERAAVSAEDPFDVEFGVSADGCIGRARHANADVDYRLRAATVAVPNAAAQSPTDALHRPIETLDGHPLVWDEDRLLLDGKGLVVCDPRCGRKVATVCGPTLLFVAGDPPERNLEHGPTYAALRDCGLEGPDDQGTRALYDWAPFAMLERVFGRKVWDPVARPTPGTSPWRPSAWTPVDGAPKAPHFRLDAQTVMRLLSPFPRPTLVVPPAP